MPSPPPPPPSPSPPPPPPSPPLPPPFSTETIHTHVSPSFRVNFWMGSLIYRHSFNYHAKNKTAVTDPIGHLFHVGGAINTPVEFEISPQMDRENGDSLVPDTVDEAETLKPGVDIGQQGRAILDYAASTITKPVESPTSTVATNLLWGKNKVFGGGRGLGGF